MTVKLPLVAALLVLALVFAGCSDSSSTAPVIDEPALRTVPGNGAVNVDPADPIYMMFNEPMDTAHFNEWFYCIDSASHDALVDSLRHGWMGMSHHHEDSATFYERMHDHMMGGEFRWFGDGDSCEFHPASPLDGDTEYVLHFRHEMRNAHGEHMQHMGQMMTEDWAVRFRTGE
jgi:hypothetical protein